MTQSLQIQKGVPKPEGLVVRQRGPDNKYPVDQMEAGDYFEVPKEWYFGDEPYREEGYNGKKHRERVNNAVRGYALRKNKDAAKAEGFDLETFKPVKFTVALLESGNVGVWRDQ
jgi:hypothetical protein